MTHLRAHWLKYLLTAAGAVAGAYGVPQAVLDAAKTVLAYVGLAP